MNVNQHIVLGLWPIAGITTVGVTQDDAEATIAAAIESGITQFDTAFNYGYNGESDRLLGRFIGKDREGFHVIGKVGQRWLPDKTRVHDGSPKNLIASAEESLRRIGIEYFDTLMLHSPDPNVPLEESANAIASLQDRGLCSRIGVCNVSLDQLETFSSVVDCRAVQCPLNLMQQDRLRDLIPTCQRRECDVYAYWALMKGLLAGKIGRDHVFPPGDVRPNYAVFQGKTRERTHRVLDQLKLIARDCEKTISQLTLGWVISQPGVTAALVGARRGDQIQETAKATPLDAELLDRINAALAAIPEP